MDSRQGLYDPNYEHDACGVGFVVDIKNRKSHEIVRQGLLILANLNHRGAVGADKLAADGAGILIQVPDELMRAESARLGISLPEAGHYGVGMVFLPQDNTVRGKIEILVERYIDAEGLPFLGWRDVPVDSSILGASVAVSEPVVRQLLVARHHGCKDQDAFERKLFVVRKIISNQVAKQFADSGKSFYIPSFSSRTINYKGMLLADQVDSYFRDLSDERLKSALALVHQRFSTNTFPTWSLAHPFRMIAHNGEINTLRGNLNWMAARRDAIHSHLLGDDLQRLWPMIPEGQSDSACFDNALELLVQGGYSLAHAMMLLIPEAWRGNPMMDEKRRAFYEYHAALMEPWDGPAAVCFTDGRQIGATLDRNGLRPARYLVTDDDKVVMASEMGVLPIPEEKIIKKWRLQPGKMLLIDLEQHRIIGDEEIKEQLASAYPYQDWLHRKAGDNSGWHWWSEGAGEYCISPDETAKRGAKIILHLRDGENEFLESYRLRNIIKTYSDHIALPVLLIDGDKEEKVNAASALWTRAKSEITTEQYSEFYHHVAHTFDEPWLTQHFRAEGAIEYTGLLFIPTEKPFDIFHHERKQHIKLYVNRIFITDDCAEILPSYLRFVRGIIDSQDLPLNVSREMLQHNPVLAKIRTGLVKRILGDLKKKSEEADSGFKKFWENFGAVLKEGLYEDFERRDDVLDLCHFRTTLSDEPIPLSRYVERMKEGQTAIYTITGENHEALKRSPQLEGFVARGIEVLLLSDPIDSFWPTAVQNYKDKPFRSVAQGSADLSEIKNDKNEDSEANKAEAASDDALSSLISAFKQTLGDSVKDVRGSDRLTESPVCLVADDGDMGIHMERLLRQHKPETANPPRILEINPRHSLIRHLADMTKKDGASEHLADAAWLLLGQACIVEGAPLSDSTSFAKRLASVLERAL